MPKLCLYFDYLLTLLEDILHGSAVVVVVEDVVDEVVVDDVIVVKSGKSGTIYEKAAKY